MESLRELAFELHLYLPHTSLQGALALAHSDAQQLLGSKAWEKWQEAQAAPSKLTVETINRLNTVIGALGTLIKTVAARRW